jgi:arginine repressor
MPKIHWFKQITVYSNLLCQENYSLQQFTVSRELQFTAIYRVTKLQFTAIYRVTKLQFTAI